ncbi:MAG: hypothetical protein QOE97_3195 [Pseudonocardiales bacterium]|nr:hypothetical protein [Pseudonocardiales bacterium]
MTATADRPVIAGGSSRHAEALLDVLTELQTRVAPAHSLADAFDAFVAVAADCIPEADYVSVGVRRGRRARTVASTHPTAIVADELQYTHECGPCVDAIEGEGGVVRCGELRGDPRWPALSDADPEIRVNSVMAVPLVIEQEGVDVTANVYALSEHAFGDDAYAVAQFVALHGASYLSGVAAAEKVRNLSEALETSREIGIAMGILMLGRKIDAPAAFDLLRTTSQRSHRKLRDVARDVAETGALEAPDPRSHSRSRPHRVTGSGERYLTGTHRWMEATRPLA